MLVIGIFSFSHMFFFPRSKATLSILAILKLLSANVNLKKSKILSLAKGLLIILGKQLHHVALTLYKTTKF